MRSSAVIRNPVIVRSGQGSPRRWSDERPLASAPRTSLIDTEWDTPVLAPRVGEHRTTLPFPIFVPSLAVAPQVPSASLESASLGTAATAAAPPRRSARIAAVAGAVALLGAVLATGLLKGADALLDTPVTLREPAALTAAATADPTAAATAAEPAAPRVRVATGEPLAATMIEKPTKRAAAASPKKPRARHPGPKPARAIVARRTDNPY